MKRLKILIGCLFVLIWTGVSFAVSGPCANCHTMHNSQGGAAVNANGPYRALTNNDCLGCHSGTNDGTNSIPYVYTPSGANYGTTGVTGNTLAGGNFYWVDAGNDAKGHNCAELPNNNKDDTLQTPPGFDGSITNANNEAVGGGTWPAGQAVTCAGKYGCHGTHSVDDDFAAIRGAHHNNVVGTTDASTATTVAGSYRFLLGIWGIEDSDYEYQPTASAHNQYYGVHRTTATVEDKHTISFLCAECHGFFHSGSQVAYSGFASPWLRHPTDFDLAEASGSEYKYYNNGDGANPVSYSVVAPVASDDLTAGVKSTVTPYDNTDHDTIVTCISCHRAHGTPYDDLLRWDYTSCQAGTPDSNCGCFICHTQKD